MAEFKKTRDIQEKLERLFTKTIEQVLESEMDEHLGCEKNSVLEINMERQNIIIYLSFGGLYRCEDFTVTKLIELIMKYDIYFDKH